LIPPASGIIGSSAGGHLASTLLTHFDAGINTASDAIERESSRPDLGILCYPVISLGEFTHEGSRDNLLGKNPSADLVRHLSNELQIIPATPPCFIWHTADDAIVPVENALLFASGLRRAGVPFDLHVYEHGRHGLGLPNPAETVPPWDVDLLFWLRQRKFL
jgi:acetyl esterase/lipase